MLGARVLPLAVLAVACGRIGYLTAADATPPRDDGAPRPDSGAIVDSGDIPDTGFDSRTLVDSGGTVVLGPFGPPVLLSTVSDPGALDDDATVTDDRLELYFASDRNGGNDIWMSTRIATADPWGAPALVPELNSGFNETAIALSPDGLSMWMGSRRGGPGGDSVYRSTRAFRGAPWSTPVLVPALSSSGSDKPGSVRSDGLGFVMHAIGRGGPGATDLFLSVRVSTAVPWGTPMQIAEINTVNSDSSPYMSPDGLTLYFATNRPGTAGPRDIWIARRPSTTVPFDPPGPVGGVNSPGRDDDPWLTSDQRYIVFTSDRSGNAELYEATR